jgi:hypothetical protein
MRITSAGNVGIGTVSPAEDLHVSSGAAEFAIQWDSTGSKSWVLGSATGRAYIRNKTDSVEVITILNSGNVGIGTTAPVTRLHVLDALSGGQLIVANSETNNGEKYGTFATQHYTNAEEPALGMAVQSNATDNNVLIGGAIGEFNAATRVSFYTAANNTTTSGTERMRITSAGNVGIGTTAAGTSAERVLAIGTGVAPTTGPADTIQIYSTDLSAGNTILSLYTEGTPVNANTTAAATHRIAVRINGTVYYLLANTAA